MTEGARPVERAGRAQPVLDVLARWGWVAKGAVYALVAVLALALALGVGGATEDTTGALRLVADEPGGGVVLVLIAAGLAFFGAWRVAQGCWAPTEHDGGREWVVRGARVLGGLLYVGFAVIAASMAIGGVEAIGGGGGGADTRAAGVMGLPGGRALVGLAGVIVAGLAVHNFWKSWTADFCDELRDDVSHRARVVARWVGRVGFAARGLAFALIATFAIKSSIEREPGEAIGLEGALAKTIAAPYGRLLLVFFAVGLLAYALHCALMAALRRM